MTTRYMLSKQKDIGRDIRSKFENFNNLAVERQNNQYIKDKLEWLEVQWNIFSVNDQQLKEAADIDGSNEYFDKEYFKETQEVYLKFRAELENLLTGFEKSKESQVELFELWKENPIPPTSQEKITIDWSTNENNGRQSIGTKQDISSNSVKDFFKAARNGNNADQAKTILHQDELMESLRITMQLHKKLKERNSTRSELTTFFNMVKNKWECIQNVHKQLIGSNDYSIRPYLDMEQEIFMILVEAEEMKENSASNNNSESAKLPKLEIPKFRGEYTKYISFKQLFQRMIGNKNNLEGCEKFAYLKGQLEGEPLTMVAHLAVENESYQAAWDLLNVRYDNRHIIITELLDKITKLEPITKNSVDSMRHLVNVASECVTALVNLGMPMNEWSNIILFNMIESKLDGRNRALYENSLEAPAEPRRYDDLMKFLNVRLQNVRSTNQKPPSYKQPNKKYSNYQKNSTSLMISQTDRMNEPIKCGDCKEKHILKHCPAFMKLTPEEKSSTIRKWKRCVNCLREGHITKNCTSNKSCKKCQKRHHTSTHFEKKEVAKALLGSTITNEGIEHVFLATAIIEVMNKNGLYIKARALLDSGSQINLMTEKMFKRLGLVHESTSMQVSGIGNSTAESRKRTMIKIQSLASSFASQMEVFVLKQITSCQPERKIDTNGWNISENITLADPAFNIPASIDIIIGGELFYKLLTNGIKSIGVGLPDIQNTVFGWVVTGKLLGLYQSQVFVGIGTEVTLNEQLAQFWRIEEKHQTSKPMNELERQCEEFFENTTKRDKATGKFIVKLQFIKEPSILGKSEQMAIRRFFSLEKKFDRDPDMKKDYVEFMREYEALGHMEKVASHLVPRKNYVIPHHAVRNPGSSTTKFRVVFDASAKTSSNVALNEILANGPILQDDLFSIMIRFRKHKYVMSADITKMYRQVLVNEHDQQWQLIVWREHPSEPLQVYKLKTLTYGTTCASYLAIKTLQTLANQHAEELPLAAAAAKRDFNVDDIMTGSDDLYETILMQQQLIELTKKANFHLHKWCSNHPALLEQIPKKKQEVSLDFNAEKTETKALGIKWIPKDDIFKISYAPKDNLKITKRTVLSETAQLFDPLGIVNPVIVLAKIFLQELWTMKIDWDTELPTELCEKWINFRKQLLKLNNISFKRHIILDDAVSIQLHAFSDACTRAYGGSFYIRSENQNGEIQSNLICSKSRVAPISAITIPRLELCGALTSVEMVEKITKALGIKFEKVYYWTDSELVLSWILNDASYKTFVANRVAEIVRKTNRSEWKYINTKLNPADMISRGVLPEVLIESELWWHGPEFLRKNETEWPESKPAFVRDETEERLIKTVLTAQITEDHFLNRINHRNSIKFLQRVVAIILRIKNKKYKDDTDRDQGRYSVNELKKAMTFLAKRAQEECFSKELELVKKGNGDKTKFTNFTPIIDADGVMRVGGRLQEANIAFEQKHPILLPKDHFITRLIMEDIHKKNKHAGAQALLALTRQKYWPEAGKMLARNIIRKCVLCVRSKPILLEQIMGSLPAERVNIARPFITVGLDFCGPFEIHYKLRGKRVSKAYVCAFVCFTTKAIHLETAADSSIDAFINCLKRFIARRGAPKKITSDNATNFRGTHNQLIEIAEMMMEPENIEKITNYCSDNEIKWKFAPARSPHFNGLSEAAVKSAKTHMKKILHSVQITYDELGTIIAEIEAILNSRPLTPMTSDPNDLQPLTAGHFLIGAPLTAIDDREVPYKSTTKMWHKIVSIRNEFWERWSKEYMAELQSKNKWRSEHKNVKEGSLVILKEDNMPPLKWKMARVTKIIPDENGKVRVVEVKTSTANTSKAVNNKTGKIDASKIKIATNTTRRAIHKICPLPVDEEKPTEPTKNTSSQVTVKKIGTKNKTKNDIRESEPIGRCTRSKGMKNHIFLVICTLMALMTGIFGNPCNYTQFSHNPGLYFEDSGKMSLINDNWKINAQISMDQYWDKQKDLKTLIDNLEVLCPKMKEITHCKVVKGQIRQQYDAIMERSEVFNTFSRKAISRKRRGWSINKFGKITNTHIEETTHNKAPIILERLQNEINRIKKELSSWSSKPNEIISRTRRGWLNCIGAGLNVATGVMDDENAKQIDNQMKALNESNSHLNELIVNQTTILDMTRHIIKNEEISVQEQFTAIQKQIEIIGNKNQEELNGLFTMLSLQTRAIISSLLEIQQALMELLMHIHHGKISPTILSPQLLKRQLIMIAENMTSDLMIPDDGTPGNIGRLYSLLNAKVHMNKNRILLTINIPLVHRDVYYLHHIVPVPFQQDNKFKIITTKEQFIGVNKRQDRYYMMTHTQQSTCREFSTNWIICEQKNILYNTQKGTAKCEMAILTHLAKNIPPKCTINELKLQQVWSKLNAPNKFVFTVENKTMINIICKDKSDVCSINGSGVISLPQQCVIQSENMEIAAENVYSSKLPIIIAPKMNITDILPEMNHSTDSKLPQIQYHIDPELDALAISIQQQHEAEKIIPRTEWHHVHHYTMLYFILATILGLGVWIGYKNCKTQQPKEIVRVAYQTTGNNILPSPAQRAVTPRPEHEGIYFP